MSYARQMLDTYPRIFNVDADLLAAAIGALDDCAQACNADNAADLSAKRGRDGHVHPVVHGLRRCLHRHLAGHRPRDRERRQPHPATAGVLRGYLPELR